MKKKKIIIIGTIGLGVIITAIVTPIVLINNANDENDKKDVEAVAKILREKTNEERIIKLVKTSSGKIIENNKDNIVSAIKTLITDSKLRGVKIEVSIENDVNISVIPTSIIVTLKKGETSIQIKEEIVGDNKGIKVKRNPLTDSDFIAEVKLILDSKITKLITIAFPQDSKINTNSQIIEKIKTILEKQVGKDNLFGVTITPSKDITNGTIISSGSGISFIITLTKGSASSIQITNWKVKREWTNKHIVDDYVIKLKRLSRKEVTVYYPIGETITENKDDIENEIKSLYDFPTLPSGVTLKVKDDSTPLWISGTSIILVIKKGDVEQELSGFIAKQSEPEEGA